MKTTPLTFNIVSNYAYHPIGVRRTPPTEYRDFPGRVSIPTPRGTFKPGDKLTVRDAKGKSVDACVTPFLHWDDGSARVWDVWTPVTLKREGKQAFELVEGSASRSSAGAKLKHDELLEPSAVVVTAVMGDGSIMSQTVRFEVRRDAKKAPAVHVDEAPFELTRAGEYTPLKGVIIRRSWSWYPGVELAVRVINTFPADTLTVKSLTLEFDLPGKGASRYAINHATFTAAGPRLHDSATPFEVRADAGGIHVTDIRQVGEQQTDYAPYERGAYAEAVDSWIGMADDSAGWVLVIPEAYERSPKGWHIRGRHVTIELHPEWAEPLKWRQGMALYQRVNLARVAKDATAEEFENEAWRWLRPPIVTVDSDVYRAAGLRIPFRFEPERFPLTEFTIRDTFSFGWDHGTFAWGDQVQGSKARNLEYDFPACAVKEWARTGRPELWKQCRASAEHMMMTDFVAVSQDQWKHGGVPHHCKEHTSGSAYPSHMWTEGLVLYHMLSADPYALEVASRLGDFFLKYIRERFLVIQATAREMGWALVALAAVYDATHEERYLDGIRTIVDFYLERGVDEFFPTDATFAIGVAIIGLDRVRHFHRDKEIQKFIIGVAEIMMTKRRDKLGLFEIWFYADQRDINYINSHLPEALRIAYELSGELKYLKAAWRLFQFHQAGAQLTVQNKLVAPECGYAAGYHITWTMGPLAAFAERGWLNTVQFKDPE